MIITIDGPTASGKSTIAYTLARDCKLTYLNTGLLYRAFAHCLVHERGYTQEDFMTPKSNDIAFVRDANLIAYSYNATDGARICYKGEIITHLLKLPHVDRWASVLSAQPEIRAALLDIQRNIARQGAAVADENNYGTDTAGKNCSTDTDRHNNRGTIADGRDCGTVVFPHADYKFFVTATPETRARRWRLDQEKRGVTLSFEAALQALLERDTRDTTRTHAPLLIPPDAHMIDNSGMTADETAEHIKKIIWQ